MKAYATDMFRYARAGRLMKGDPTEDLGHALASRVAKRRRTSLKARELPEFFGKLDSYDSDERTRLALKLVALTFELRFAKWDQFEGAGGNAPTWRMPAEVMKMRQGHLPPLSPQAVAVLARAKAVY